MGLNKIGVISTFPPTQCGIATYATDLIEHLNRQYPLLEICRFELINNLSINENGASYNIIKADDPEDFINAAEIINSSDIDLLDIQHEFKIYGRPDGENVLIILDKVRKPVVTTLHTVSPGQSKSRENILKKILEKSKLLFVFSNEAKQSLIERYKANQKSIAVIPHGTPSVRFQFPDEEKAKQNCPYDLVFVSSGHMRSTKGYEIAIQALNQLRLKLGRFHYYILGSDHPQNENAQNYRGNLLDMIEKYNLTKHITFIDRYLPLDSLINYIQLADICLLPYTRKEQSSSGVLALMIACGRPIVSTPFQFASSILTSKSGVLSESFQQNEFTRAIELMFERKAGKIWYTIIILLVRLGTGIMWQGNIFLDIVYQLI